MFDAAAAASVLTISFDENENGDRDMEIKVYRHNGRQNDNGAERKKISRKRTQKRRKIDKWAAYR